MCEEEQDSVESGRQTTLTKVLHQFISEALAHLRTGVVCDQG